MHPYTSHIVSLDSRIRASGITRITGQRLPQRFIDLDGRCAAKRQNVCGGGKLVHESGGIFPAAGGVKLCLWVPNFRAS